jgi:hypothetical protein
MPHPPHLPLPQISRQIRRTIVLRVRVRVDFRKYLRTRFTVYTRCGAARGAAREGGGEEVAWLALAGGGCAGV